MSIHTDNDQPALLDLGPAAPVAQHTPGPWIVEDGIITNERGYMVAEAPDVSGRPENKANARLIAAAPDLLAALRAAVEALRYSEPVARQYPEPHIRHSNALGMALAAIAKAEGRS